MPASGPARSSISAGSASTEPFNGLFTQGMVTHETYQAPATARWLSPEEVEQARRRLSSRDRAAGRRSAASTRCPSPRRMSWTRTTIIERYGADAVRWFMLSDSPPERDLPWTEAGIEGAWRFVQRLWRLFGSGRRDGQRRDDKALDRKLHQTIAGIAADIEALAFNKAVAQDL